ncbi:hypothetical protein SBA4_3960009 [Candidatus Sulfopaludibacter sp. SbA4]|nr:hypothetical protein SBA4_3960009 [Candidatus Sulfopaludibacter sp. SbA4]
MRPRAIGQPERNRGGAQRERHPPFRNILRKRTQTADLVAVETAQAVWFHYRCSAKPQIYLRFLGTRHIRQEETRRDPSPACRKPLIFERSST